MKKVHGFPISPDGLALDREGNIHVAEDVSIKVFTKEGVYVRTYGGPGVEDGTLESHGNSH